MSVCALVIPAEAGIQVRSESSSQRLSFGKTLVLYGFSVGKIQPDCEGSLVGLAEVGENFIPKLAMRSLTNVSAYGQSSVKSPNIGLSYRNVPLTFRFC